jgi:Anti-sigma-K factor rskA
VNPPERPAHEDWADYLDPLVTEPSGPGLPPAERAALDAIAGQLKDESLWSAPPPPLRASLLAKASAEQQGAERQGAQRQGQPDDGDPAPGHPTPEFERRSGGRRVRAQGRLRRTPWLVAAAAAAAMLIGGGALLWPRSHPASFPMAGTALAPRASAVAELTPKSAGVAIRLKITGLKPAPPGTFYAAWLRGPAGVVPVGTFHWHKGGIPIDLWSGVGTDRYPELFVTLQREGAAPSPSDQLVLDGHAS